MRPIFRNYLREKFAIDIGLLALFAAIMLVLALSGCSSSSTSAAIAGLETALASAETIAQQYRELPPCGASGATAACSNGTVVVKLQAMDNIAYEAITKARDSYKATGAADLAAAEAAISALQQAVNALPILKQ